MKGAEKKLKKTKTFHTTTHKSQFYSQKNPRRPDRRILIYIHLYPYRVRLSKYSDHITHRTAMEKKHTFCIRRDSRYVTYVKFLNDEAHLYSELPTTFVSRDGSQLHTQTCYHDLLLWMSTRRRWVYKSANTQIHSWRQQGFVPLKPVQRSTLVTTVATSVVFNALPYLLRACNVTYALSNGAQIPWCPIKDGGLDIQKVEASSYRNFTTHIGANNKESIQWN